MAVKVRGHWGLPQCTSFSRNHARTTGGKALPEFRRLKFSAIQIAQAGAAATRDSNLSEGYLNGTARARLFADSNTASASESRRRKGQALSNRSSTTSSRTRGMSSGNSSSTSNSNIDDGSRHECSGEDAEALQDAVERSFSVFDAICRNCQSPNSRSRTFSATQAAKPTRPAVTAQEDIQRAVTSTQPLSIPFPSSRTKEGPAVLLSVLRDLTNARVRTPEAWAPPLLLLMQQLPLLCSSELQQATALLSAAGCRAPLLLQGLCEAFSWRAAAKQTEASQTVLFLDSLRRLR